jgi:hypothetical protein
VCQFRGNALISTSVSITKSKSKSKLCYDRSSVGQCVLVSSAHLGLTTRFCYSQTVAGMLMWGALSDERTGLPFTIPAGLCQSFLGPSPLGLAYIFYCLRFDSPNLEGQVPVFISPGNRVARLYPQALGSLFVASYVSQGYGGTDRIENTVSIDTSIVTRGHVPVGTCLFRCLYVVTGLHAGV